MLEYAIYKVSRGTATVKAIESEMQALISLKTPAKIHLKIPSAFVVCCKFLLTLFNKVKY